jgi:hypothetical protein
MQILSSSDFYELTLAKHKWLENSGRPRGVPSHARGCESHAICVSAPSAARSCVSTETLIRVADRAIACSVWSAPCVHSALPSDRFRAMTRPPKLFSTLADLDVRATTLPRARNWLNYPYFMFARYPHLRPLMSGKTFWQRLGTWEHRIESDSKARRALADLEPELRKQLAAFCVDVISELEMHAKKVSRPPKTFAAEAKRRARMLKRKRERVRRELKNLLRYASSLDRLLAGDDEEVARRCLEILGGIRDYSQIQTLEALRGPHPVPDDPIVRGMVDLYWFFRQYCKLTGDEAEVRVAILRNAFWTEYGASRVEYLPAYRTGESQGCSAVHEAVRRFRPTRDTSE